MVIKAGSNSFSQIEASSQIGRVRQQEIIHSVNQAGGGGGAGMSPWSNFFHFNAVCVLVVAVILPNTLLAIVPKQVWMGCECELLNELL